MTPRPTPAKMVSQRRERAPGARAGAAGHHSLPEAPELHRARLRPCTFRRPHRGLGRKGAGAEARAGGLRLARGRCTPMSAIDSFRHQFLEHAGRWHGQEPSWLSLVRREAFERFLDRGFPTTNDEDWRFTSVAPLASMEFSLDAGTGREHGSSLLRSHLGEDWKRHEIVFVNGRFSPELSAIGALPPGVVVESLASALESHAEKVEAVLSLNPAEGATGFSDLNRAFLADGAFVLVPRGGGVGRGPGGLVGDRPIHIVHVSSAERPAGSHPHHIVLLERGAEVRLEESYLGDDGPSYFTNP